MQDSDYMQRALVLAGIGAAAGEVPVGAVVVLDGEIIGEGYNCPITTADPTAHAEVVALRAAAARVGNYRLPGSTLYVTIEPCTMCAGAIVHARVARVVFGACEPKSGSVVSNAAVFDAAHLNHRVAYEGGVLEDACGQCLRDFFRQRREALL